ncbi:tetratricopeptide repeat protein [Pseudomonas syringae]|uniref:tetratricopeptide repeat protein n=1 Tax=Pseudomonas syringae TaxID=317 RepID=UPI001F3300C3|nr:hypothetical protein [Pseudomonas syringae]MCF5704529.1 hypothetical protein [Pseudomonas syringae]
MIEQWKQDFRQNPEKAITDLMSGRASFGASMRRDVPEILFHAFPDEGEFIQDRDLLDTAMLSWLTHMRNGYSREVSRLGFDVYSKRLCDAFRALQLLKLPRCIHHIREVHEAWLRWLRPLRIAPERDPALESWRLLGLVQRADESPSPWMQLARDPRPEYLAVALLGLQLPSVTKDRQVLMVAALLHHYERASGNVENNAANFNRSLSALRGRFPRGPAYWREILKVALSDQSGKTTAISKELVRQSEMIPEKKANAQSRGSSRINCPSREQKEQVLHAIKNPQIDTKHAASLYLKLVKECRDYTLQTGDSYFFVRTLCHHGDQLLKRLGVGPQQVQEIGSLIEDALKWEPFNEYIWTFWASLFAYTGFEQPQEWILRETVRIFPENSHCRVELARLLLRQSDSAVAEAEMLLRDVESFNPGHEPARVELSRLLVCKGQEFWGEAEVILRDTAEMNRDNAHSRVELAKLLTRTYRRPEALTLLRSISRNMIADGAAIAVLKRVERGDEFTIEDFKQRKVVSGSIVSSDEIPSTLKEVKHRSELQRIYASASQNKSAQVELLKQAESGDALAGFYCQWLELDAPNIPSPPPHAWAWKVAGFVQNPSSKSEWDAIDKSFSEYRDVTRFVHWLSDLQEQDEELRVDVQRCVARLKSSQDLSVFQRFICSTWQQLESLDAEQRVERKKRDAFKLLHASAEEVVY